MPKPPTYPPKLKSVHRIEIGLQKKQGHFVEGKKFTSLIQWECRGVINARAYFTSDLINDECSISYFYDNYKAITTTISLERVKSNLGNGELIYFICPYTGLRCRILYRIGKYFQHREAYPNAMYATQTESKKDREFRQSFGWYYQNQKLIDTLNSKHFKRLYNGRLTKRFEKISSRLNQVNSITKLDFNNWLG